ncbi:hypothetical protein [Metabacillus niabensis]|nr:hypothetical protein [Metabacillus niabensis]
MFFNEFTHKVLYDFFLYELQVEQNKLNDHLYEDEGVLETSTQKK